MSSTSQPFFRHTSSWLKKTLFFWLEATGSNRKYFLWRIKCNIFPGDDPVVFWGGMSNDVSLLLRVGIPLPHLTATLASRWCHINQPAAPGRMSSLWSLPYLSAVLCLSVPVTWAWLAVLIKRQWASVCQFTSSLIDHLNEVTVLWRVAGD